MTTNTQQNYLYRAAGLIGKEFGFKVKADDMLFSYGFPKGRGRGKVIGQCFYKPCPTGYAGAIFVHPCQWKSAYDVLHVLLHELIHAETPGAGHKGEFVKLCKAVGLVKPWTATTAGPECKAKLEGLALSLGEFPQADFDLMKAPVKQVGRLRLWECGCGVKCRVASDDFSATCGECEGPFERQEKKP